jgi:ABC-type lipoprotein release transport system permease subunit
MMLKGTTIHLICLGIWIALIIPTILYWRESVFWVSLMSIYAIISTHWAAYQAARAEENN